MNFSIANTYTMHPNTNNYAPLVITQSHHYNFNKMVKVKKQTFYIRRQLGIRPNCECFQQTQYAIRHYSWFVVPFQNKAEIQLNIVIAVCWTIGRTFLRNLSFVFFFFPRDLTNETLTNKNRRRRDEKMANYLSGDTNWLVSCRGLRESGGLFL